MPDDGGRSGHASTSIMEELRQLSVGELKRALQDRHIDYTGCFEKEELLMLLAPKLSEGGVAGGGVHGRASADHEPVGASGKAQGPHQLQRNT